MTACRGRPLRLATYPDNSLSRESASSQYSFRSTRSFDNSGDVSIPDSSTMTSHFVDRPGSLHFRTTRSRVERSSVGGAVKGVRRISISLSGSLLITRPDNHSAPCRRNETSVPSLPDKRLSRPSQSRCAVESTISSHACDAGSRMVLVVICSYEADTFPVYTNKIEYVCRYDRTNHQN